MAPSPVPPSVATLPSLLLLLLLLHPLPTSEPAALTDDAYLPAYECTMHLLLLAPCGPFVQGLDPSPPDECCDNFANLYSRHPLCLCMLLNHSIVPIPINQTLALQLPLLCNVTAADASRCSAGAPPPCPASSGSYSAPGAAATTANPPRPGGSYFIFGQSAEAAGGFLELDVVLAAVTFALAMIFNIDD